MDIIIYEKFNLLDGSFECRDNQILRYFLKTCSRYIDQNICTLDWYCLYKSAQCYVKTLNDVTDGLQFITLGEDPPAFNLEDPYSDEPLYKQCCKFQSQDFCEEILKIMQYLRERAVHSIDR